MTHGEGVVSASFSPDGKRVVTASEDKTARVWDADTGKPMGEPMTHGEGGFSAGFSPDGKHVVTASLDKTARVWDAGTGTVSRAVSLLEAARKGVVRSVSLIEVSMADAEPAHE